MMRKIRTRRQEHLSSTISITADLLSDMSKARAKLLCYPNIMALPGNKTEFVIKNNDSPEFYKVELKETKILFTTFSNISPLYSMKDSLLKMISIMEILSEDFTFYFDSIAPYFTNALKNHDLKVSSSTRKSGNQTEVILSKRVISLIKSNGSLLEEVKRVNDMLISVSSELILTRCTSGSNIKAFERETGLSSTQISDVFDLLQVKGYKIIFSKRDEFSVVKI
jgi:hypothetical protein